MPVDDRPTAAEKADAADRFVDAEHRALAAIREMFGILRERQERGASRRAGPLFPWNGDHIAGRLDQAQQALWDAHKIVAAAGYDSHRAARREPPS